MSGTSLTEVREVHSIQITTISNHWVVNYGGVPITVRNRLGRKVSNPSDIQRLRALRKAVRIHDRTARKLARIAEEQRSFEAKAEEIVQQPEPDTTKLQTVWAHVNEVASFFASAFTFASADNHAWMSALFGGAIVVVTGSIIIVIKRRSW